MRARSGPARTRRRAALVLAVMGLTGAYLDVSFSDDVPTWAAADATATDQHAAAHLRGGDAVFGSTRMVRHLERAMVAQDAVIDVTSWAPRVGATGVVESIAEAVAVNPFVFVDTWSTTSTDAATLVHPDYLYSREEAERRRAALVAEDDA